MDAPNYVQGQYTVAQRDAFFNRIAQYPPAEQGLVNQVPTLSPDGAILWRNQSSGGEDGTANANIAPIESTATASQAYAVGALLVYGGQLYRVTAAIAAGDTLTVGTNIAPTTVAAAKQDATAYSAADLNAYLAMVAAAPNEGGFAPAGFGLGTSAKWLDSSYDLDTIYQFGSYSWTHSQFPTNVPSVVSPPGASMLVCSGYAPNRATTQIIFPITLNNVSIRRTGSPGVSWGEWEWVNPPLVLNTEYRTTERYLGRPVYVKALNPQNLSQNGATAFLHGVSNLSGVISVEGFAGMSPLAHFLHVTGFEATAANLNIFTSGAATVSASPIIKYTKTTG